MAWYSEKERKAGGMRTGYRPSAREAGRTRIGGAGGIGRGTYAGAPRTRQTKVRIGAPINWEERQRKLREKQGYETSRAKMIREQGQLYGSAGKPAPATNQPYQQQQGQYQDYQPFMSAMDETQRRAAEDRMRALETMREGTTGALGGYMPAAEMMGQYREMMDSAYQPAQELMSKLSASPESIDTEKAFAKARIPIEAQTQALSRRTQEAGGGVPSGYTLGRIGGIQEAGIGATGQTMGDIQLEAMKQRRTDLLNALQAAQGLGGQRLQSVLGGINTAGGLAGQMANIGMRGAQSQADILGQTIAAVPQLGQQPYQQGGGVYRPDVPESRHDWARRTDRERKEEEMRRRGHRKISGGGQQRFVSKGIW